MSDINTAVDAIRKQARLYEPLVKVADALEKIGSLENAQKEHEAAIASLSAEKEKLSKDVKGLKDKLADGLADINDAINTAKEKAGAEVEEAKTLAAKLIADANDKVISITNKANEKAEGITLAAYSKLAELEQKALKAQEATKEALTLQEAAQAELDVINKKIDAAKAKVAALLG